MPDLLIIKPSSLGDIIHGLVAAQSIRDQMPDARISWVVAERFADVVEGCPTVNGDVFRYQRNKGIRGIGRVCSKLRKQSYDCVIDWQGLARSALMTRAPRCRRRIGRSDAREGAWMAYTERTPLPPAGRDSHAISILLEALPLLGLEPRTGTSIELPGKPVRSVAPALADHAPIVLIPNSRGRHKEWPGFVDLTRELLRDPDCPPIVWDSHVEWPTPGDIDDDRLYNLTGKTDLATLISLLSSARLVVVNDAGPLHIAAATGTPLLGLFGPTSPNRFGPFPPDAPGNHVLIAPGGDLHRLAVSTVATAVRTIAGHEQAV